MRFSHTLLVHDLWLEHICIFETTASIPSKLNGYGSFQVIVIEKGTYTPAAELSTLEKDAYENLYERGGLFMATEDGGKVLSTFTQVYPNSSSILLSACSDLMLRIARCIVCMQASLQGKHTKAIDHYRAAHKCLTS